MNYRLVLIILLISSNVFGQNPKIKKAYNIQINEFLAWNISIIKDAKGNYSDWIELKNNTNKSIDLSGFYLTDDPNNLTKWKIPKNSNLYTIRANKTMHIWCSKKLSKTKTKTANFNLRKEGEYLAIVAFDGKTILDEFHFKKQYPNVSMGRDSLKKWVYFKQPSPYKDNPTTGAKKIIFKPVINFNKKDSIVNFYHPDPKVKFYYTIDGTQPEVEDAILFTAPFKINKTCIVKCIAVKNKNFESLTANKSFIFEEHQLPIIALSVHPRDIHDPGLGIFFGKNFRRNLEKLANLEYYNEKGIKIFSEDVTIKGHGMFSGTYPQKSLVIKNFSKDPNAKLNFPFFSNNKDLRIFNSILLRNASNDWLGSRLRDPIAQEILRQGNFDLDLQEFSPVIMYLNGEYYGIYNLREKISTQYIKQHHENNLSKFNIVEKSIIKVKGDKTSYMDLLSYVDSKEKLNDQDVNYISKKIQMKNFIDYYISEIYLNNFDWPQNNIKTWNAKQSPKWRWITYDLDQALKVTKYNSLEMALGKNEKKIAEYDTIYTFNCILYSKLMTNENFKKKFVNKMFYHINEDFNPEKCKSITDSLANLIRLEMPQHLNHWMPIYLQYKTSNTANYDYMDHWQRSIDEIKRFLDKRPQTMIDELKTQRWINGTIKISYKGEISNIEANRYSIKSSENTYSKNYGVQLTYIPKEGKAFKYWLVNGKKKKGKEILVNKDAEVELVIE